MLGSPYPADHLLFLVLCAFCFRDTLAQHSHHLCCCCIFTFAAFESSADDTAVAVVRSDRTVLSNVVIKQHAQCVLFQYSGVRALICSHEQYGGIQPSVAISWHQRNLVRVYTSPLRNTTEYPFLSSSHLRSNEPWRRRKSRQ